MGNAAASNVDRREMLGPHPGMRFTSPSYRSRAHLGSAALRSVPYSCRVALALRLSELLALCPSAAPLAPPCLLQCRCHCAAPFVCTVVWSPQYCLSGSVGLRLTGVGGYFHEAGTFKVGVYALWQLVAYSDAYNVSAGVASFALWHVVCKRVAECPTPPVWARAPNNPAPPAPGINWNGWRFPPRLRVAQHMPRYRLPDSKCQLQWHLQPTATAPDRFGSLQPPI